MQLESLREELVRLHQELPRHGLAVWTGGNVSARDPETGLVAIKPSGIRYPDLTAERMVVVDLDGQIVEGTLQPSSDTASHLYIYRHRPEINGVVHTHSRYATAFAAVGRSIPVYLTAQADEFGGEIPCAGFAFIGDDSIGALVVEGIGRSSAILLKNHGVFTIGRSAQAAVKSAVMVEDIAATVWAALQIGNPDVLPDDAVERLHRRYTTIYGQEAEVQHRRRPS
jgi:Ribulose-5-phosphate 4-epimerase and related epimerases and aldolases